MATMLRCANGHTWEMGKGKKVTLSGGIKAEVCPKCALGGVVDTSRR